MGRGPDRERQRLTVWILIATALGAGAESGACTFLVDGAPVDRLDCDAGGAWVVRCPLPAEPEGKVRLHATLAGRDWVAEARIPATGGPSVDVQLSGPGGRAGGFVVTRPATGLLPGQALGPNQWCPVVQPDVVPGSPRAELQLDVTLAIHRQTGFAEELLDGGVTNRVPIYDAGTPLVSGRTAVLAREVGIVPILSGPGAVAPVDERVRGQLSVAGPDGVWRSFGWTGERVERPVETGDVTVLVLDFIAPEVATASGADPVAWLEADVKRWLARDPTSLLGHAAWGRSGFEPSGKSLPFEALDRSRKGWRVARDERLEIRTWRAADALRVVIAWRAAPWDDAVRKQVDAAAAEGL